ncbi:hypothetical protein CEXT_106531 [Caerostris extrusa]|uniref:Uncharacterized protein n=1 Tax=Caerostris extrusa TaxID=172846 RepID=A0AAV4S9Q6_CAEEX|nr:hypothetical protein CEXT_106531 [Caerostris extrusa]
MNGERQEIPGTFHFISLLLCRELIGRNKHIGCFRAKGNLARTSGQDRKCSRKFGGLWSVDLALEHSFPSEIVSFAFNVIFTVMEEFKNVNAMFLDHLQLDQEVSSLNLTTVRTSTTAFRNKNIWHH